jgi:hypothetical protein
MTPIDKNPRHFFIDAVSIDANVIHDAEQDFVTIEFAGRMTPTLKQRLGKALAAGEFEITDKKLG